MGRRKGARAVARTLELGDPTSPRARPLRRRQAQASSTLRLMLAGALALGALLLAASTSEAQELVVGDAAAGATKYATCASCHGPGGNSVIAAQPILAGQHAEYTKTQLINYKNGTRANAVMGSLAAVLTEQDAADIAVYLQEQQAGLSGAIDEALARQGELLYRNGNVVTGLPNCTGCHGPAGRGIPPLYPRLSGQHAEYTITTLTEFKQGIRVNAVMNAISMRLSDEEIAALAEYIAGLY